MIACLMKHVLLEPLLVVMWQSTKSIWFLQGSDCKSNGDIIGTLSYNVYSLDLYCFANFYNPATSCIIMFSLLSRLGQVLEISTCPFLL